MTNQVQRFLPPTRLLILCLSFQFFSAMAVCQTASPSDRDSLLAEIRADADRHAQNGAPMQTQLILDLYGNNTVGLTLPEIAHSYEEEYVRQKKALEPGPWEKLKPSIAWIVAGILALSLIFYKVLEKVFSQLITSVGSRLWNRMASSRFFKGLALQRYQKGLSERYSELRIPFSNRPLKMREVYVPLKVAGSTGTDQLDAHQAVAKDRRLMIVGPPGSGKSMLLKYLAFNYGEGHMSNLPDRPVPILLELHYLTEKPNLTLEQHLAEALARSRFPHGERFVSQNLPRGTLIVLLDGLDEINSSERTHVINKIRDLLDTQRDCRVIITCRSAVYKGEFADKVDQTLEIVEFTDQQIRSFLCSWEPYMHDGRSVEQLMHTLRDRPRIMALARNPLLLTIIAYLYTDTPYVLPHSRAEFYRQSTDVLLRQWHQERNHYESRDKQAVLQHLALYFMDSTSERQQDRLSVDFQAVMEQVKNLLPKLNLRQDEDVRPLLNEIVERSGLLLSIDGGQRYQFAHLTLQEYFAAEEMMDDPNGLITRFLADHDPWRETIKLWCGLGPNSTKLVHTVYEADEITGFECLADAKLVDQDLSDRILNAFCERLGTGGESEDAISRAFGAVAADLRPRGAAVFGFLKNTLANDVEPTRRVAAATALSLTNLPEAAKTLADHYAGELPIRLALVRMGDLAVPALEALANAGDLNALEDLEAIGTPQAAEVLVGLLWHDSISLANCSAWRLAGLISNANVEDALRRYPLSETQRRAERIDWIWQPFEEPFDTSLSIIAGRIALHLDRAPMQSAPVSPPKMDPRLISPLCCIRHYTELVNSLFQAEPTKAAIDAISNLEGVPKDRIEARFIPYLRDVFSGDLERDLSAQAPALRDIMDAIINSPRITDRLAYLLRSLETETQVRVVAVLERRRAPTAADWMNLFRPVKYDIANGWHYRVLTAFGLVISSFALYEIGFILYQRSGPLLQWHNAFLLLAAVPMLVAPRVLLWAGSSSYEIYERRPADLLKFGLLGVVIAPVVTIVKLLDDLKTPRLIDLDDIMEYFQMIACGVWLPLVWYFTTPRLLLRLTWPLLVVVWLGVLCLSGWIAIRGTRLDNEATNPLHGILDKRRVP